MIKIVLFLFHLVSVQEKSNVLWIKGWMTNNYFYQSLHIMMSIIYVLLNVYLSRDI